MNTRLGLYCDRVIEAGWLAAAILTPLFFNVYSSRVFEPDKLTLLRSIALVMALAWLIRSLEQAVSSPGGAARPGEAGAKPPIMALRQSLGATPLLLPVLLLVVVYILTTVVSIVPRTSLWGSYQRLEGTYTTLAYIVIFFVTWPTLRTRAQLERLLNVIILTSLPVALYGVLQHYGLDPLPWGGDVVERVTGTLGNAIFIAAYLIMAFFITLERTVARFRRLLSHPDSSLADAFMGGAYLFILVLQVLAIYFSKSRGPWLGMMAGAYVFVLITLVALRRSAPDRRALSAADIGKAVALAVLSPLVAVLPAYLALILGKRGRRWLWLSWCIQSLLVLVFLVSFNLPHSPLAPLRRVPGLGRLGQVFETETGTGRVRVLIWDGCIDLLKSNPVRVLVGYGPESMYVAYNRFYPPDLAHYEARNASPDRAHNETFDALIMTGAIGFLAYMALFVSIFYYGLRWLGFIAPWEANGPGKGHWQRTLFFALTISGAALGGLVMVIVDRSLRFVGVGIPVGLVAGVALFLAISAFSRAGEGEVPVAFGPRELLLVGLVAMIVAHFVEIQFSLAIAATRTYFWLGLAILIAVGGGRLSPESRPGAPVPVAPRPVPVALSRHKRKRRREARAEAALGATAVAGRPLAGAIAVGFAEALVLGTLFVDYTTNIGGETNPLRVLWQALTIMRPLNRAPQPSPGILALVFLTWILGAILVVGEAENLERRPDRNWWGSALGLYLGLSLTVGVIYGLVHAAQLQGRSDLGRLIYYYYIFVMGIVLLAAVYLPGRRLQGGRLWEKSWLWAYPIAAGVAVILILANATVVRADIYYKQAWDGFHRRAMESLNNPAIDRTTVQRYYDSALYYYDQALRYAPSEDYYLLFFGKALLERAEITTDAKVQEQYLLKSEQVLQQARKLNPLNTDHTANLARLYQTWAKGLADATARQQKLEQAAQYYTEAVKLSPQNAVLYNEWGATLLALGQPEQALAKLQESLALDDRFAQTYQMLGDYYIDQKDYAQAIDYYQKAAVYDPRSVQVHSTLAFLYPKVNKLTEAISENLQVLGLYPQDYTTHKNLAVLYSQTGQLAQALQEAETARKVAPEGDQKALDEMIAQLQAALQPEVKP